MRSHTVTTGNYAPLLSTILVPLISSFIPNDLQALTYATNTTAVSQHSTSTGSSLDVEGLAYGEFGLRQALRHAHAHAHAHSYTRSLVRSFALLPSLPLHYLYTILSPVFPLLVMNMPGNGSPYDGRPGVEGGGGAVSGGGGGGGGEGSLSSNARSNSNLGSLFAAAAIHREGRAESSRCVECVMHIIQHTVDIVHATHPFTQDSELPLPWRRIPHPCC